MNCPAIGSNDFALVTEGHPLAGVKCAGFEQRVLHPRDLFLHGFKRLPDDHGPHFARTQVSHFLDLQEIKKRIGLGGGHQSGFFPSCQLARREPQYAKQVRSGVSVHSNWKLSTYYQ